MISLSQKEANDLIHKGVSQSVITPDYNIGNTNIDLAESGQTLKLKMK